ncbi:hypothetical protein N9337_02995 [Candidatus Pelagibacter sp.]|nr:hypothetical protein [Candidatus Pelagibacter sp.]
MNFLKKIFSQTILTFSFLLLIYIFYKSEVIFGGQRQNFYFIYYIISLILISFSIFTFFINDKIKEYLIISVISLFVSTYLFEGYLSFKKQLTKEQLTKTKEQLYKKRTGNKWDKREMKEIYKELKKDDKKISVRVIPKFYFRKNNHSIYSLSGISNSKLIHCNESGYYSIYQSDKYGFNNPNTEWEKNEIEYFLVGDSFTEGACVNRPNDIASVLRKLSNKSVLNLGQGGNGPLMKYGTLREYLNTNIKKVLWIYYEGNDLSDLNREKYDILINYLKDLNFTQNLKLKQNQIDDLNINFINKNIAKKKVGYVSKLIKFIEISNIRSLISEATAPPPEFKKILQLSKELTKKNNSKLYFVYLPEYSRYKKNYNNSNYNLVKNIVTELKIPFIDIHKEVFEKEQNPLTLFPFELYGHYNVTGYKKVAETIYKFTKN